MTQRDAMSDMAICEICALHDAGEAERANAIESIRSQRLVLAILNGAEDAGAEISDELNGCLMCVSRLAVIYLFGYAEALRHMAGGDANEAAKWIEQGLAADIDDQHV